MCLLAKAISSLKSLNKLYFNFWFNSTASDNFCYLLADSLNNLNNITEIVLIFQENNIITD